MKEEDCPRGAHGTGTGEKFVSHICADDDDIK